MRSKLRRNTLWFAFKKIPSGINMDLRMGRAWRRVDEVEIEEGSDHSRRMERKRQI